MIKSTMKSVKKEKWKNKALHGQYPKLLETPHVDIVTTNKWLSSNLKGETEGLLVPAQDQALNTRNYQKVICGQKVESKCRMCSQYEETVDHIVSGCEVLAKTEYISRHDKAAAYLHWNICQDHDIEVIDKWYEHKPESVTHNKDSKPEASFFCSCSITSRNCPSSLTVSLSLFLRWFLIYIFLLSLISGSLTSSLS